MKNLLPRLSAAIGHDTIPFTKTPFSGLFFDPQHYFSYQIFVAASNVIERLDMLFWYK
jgi:hypothetical protein